MTKLTGFWKKLVKPEAVEALYQEVYRTKEFEPHLEKKEPNWQAEVKRLGLPDEEARELAVALKRLWLLPFHAYEETSPLLRFCYTDLPKLEKKAEASRDERKKQLCVLLRVFVKMALQGHSIHPQDPCQLGRLALRALTSGASDNHWDALLRLLVDGKGGIGKSGFNALDAEDPNLIVQSEHERREGRWDPVWKSHFKYDAYREKVLADPEFRADWAMLKKSFPLNQFRDSNGILRRSLLPERNWQREPPPDLGQLEQRFWVAFDFFCWKWFLYGMRNDQPIVEKLYFAETPQGTQIFIPGYWSFDATRDIDWKKLLKLHRARGVARQGEKLEANRKARAQQLRKLAQAVRESKRLKLRGKAKFQFLKNHAAFATATDDAQIRRLVKEAMA